MKITRPEQVAFNQEDAALYCGVTVDTVKRARRAGDLPAVYPTARPMFRRGDLDSWVSSWPAQPPGRTA